MGPFCLAFLLCLKSPLCQLEVSWGRVCGLEENKHVCVTLSSLHTLTHINTSTILLLHNVISDAEN